MFVFGEAGRHGVPDIHPHERPPLHREPADPAGGAISLQIMLALVSLLLLAGIAAGRNLDDAWRWIGHALPVALGALWIAGLWQLTRLAQRGRAGGRPAPWWSWAIPVVSFVVAMAALYVVSTHSTAW